MRVYFSHFTQLSNDTNDLATIYSIGNNYDNSNGVTQVAQGVIYKNEGSLKSQPYIKVKGKEIMSGFIECSTVWGGTGDFKGDTMCVNFEVKPTSGPAFSMKCKYKKL